jgi:hypothetical protein
LKQKLIKNMTVVIFVGVVFIVSIINFIKPDKVFSESENRFLAKKPEFSFEALFNRKYTSAVEAYITDQFIWRDVFVGVKTQTEYFSGRKDTNGVYFSKDGYLIEKHDNTKIENELLNRNIDRLYEFMKTTSNKLGHNRVSVILVPTASNILKDKLPAYATQFDQDTMIDTIKQGMKQGKFLDLRPVLDKHSSEYIYYKTDHHWTTNGAYYAYAAWCDEMDTYGMKKEDFDIKIATKEFYGTIYSKARLSSTKPDDIYTYVPKQPMTYKVNYNMGSKITNTLYENEFLKKRDKYALFIGGNNPVIQINSSTQNGKKLLIIKDSFAHCFAPFVANDFEEVHMLDLRYVNMSVESYMAQNGITDVMVLYNTINFATETNLIKLNR